MLILRMHIAQRKMAQNGRKCFPIPEISRTYRTSGSLNPIGLVKIVAGIAEIGVSVHAS